MPTRLIRDRICKSESIDSLTWFEEVFFYRLITICDDYGRYDARAKVLKADLFPLKDGVTINQIEKALNKLSTVGMVQVYVYDQKPFLQLVTWEKYQSVRNKKSKYPEPPPTGEVVVSHTIENNCMQLHANAPVIQSESESESVSPPSPPEGESNDGNVFEGRVFSDALKQAVTTWLAYKQEKRQPYVPTGRSKLLSQIENNVKTYGEAAVVELIDESMASNYQGITWDKLKKNGQAIGNKPAKSRFGGLQV